MSVKIRLSRVGRKKTPQFRIVVMDSRNRRDGAFIDQIGIYHPSRQPVLAEVVESKALHWLGVGAIPSETVRSLFSKQGIMLKHELARKKASSEKVEMALAAWREKSDAKRAKQSAKPPKKKTKSAETSA